jgi:S1-C subfamily serine protease
LQKGDIIVSINEFKVIDVESAQLAVADITVGERIKLQIVRDGQKQEILIEAVEFK